MDKEKSISAYAPKKEEQASYMEVINDVIQGRTTIQKSYNQFNGRNLYDCIDDWSKRWNGYLPIPYTLTEDRSNMFINFTRNLVISYLSKVALQRPNIKIAAVNKKNNLSNLKFAEILHDLVEYSHNAENADSRFLESALECAVKGTVIKYEGYLRMEQEEDVPDNFDSETGKLSTKKEKRILFDNCYQELVATEDFYIANPYQPDVQKQPWVIWKKITTENEAAAEFGHYSKWKYVKPGNYTIECEPSTFYRNQLYTELKGNQVEILRYYNRGKNKHVILCNGVPLFDGIIPRKDGKYPFAKGIHEPFGNDFFWGMGMPQKIMGDQDLINTMWNMMVDKTYGSLMPFGLSSDLDDLVDDTILEPNKIRKVGDINNWRFETLPGVNAGEQAMLQSAITFIREDSGAEGGGSAGSQKGGKVSMRQAMLKQQDAMTKLGFSSSYLEDFERDRTELRLGSILQFYSIPKIQKITGKGGKEVEDMVYRQINLDGTKLPDGRTGSKVIQLVDNGSMTKDKVKKLADDLSVTEVMGEMSGTPTQALALSIDTFYDYNLRVQVVKASSYERNQMLDRAERLEYANWRLGLAQIAPCNADEIIRYVDESYDIDSDRFKSQTQPQQDPAVMAAAGQKGQADQQGAGNAPASLSQQSKPSVTDALQ